MEPHERMMMISYMMDLIRNKKMLGLDKEVIIEAREVIKHNVSFLKSTL